MFTGVKFDSEPLFGSDRSPVNANLHSFVRPMKSVLELTIFIFLSQVSLRSVSGLEALLPHFVVQSEPKILRLVVMCTTNVC